VAIVNININQVFIIMNLTNCVKEILMEQIRSKYTKPTPNIEKVVYNILNKYVAGSNVYLIKHYETRYDLEWCKDGKIIMELALFFQNDESVWDDPRKMMERAFISGTLFIPKGKFKETLNILSLRGAYLTHLMLQWFEDTQLDEVNKIVGRDDIDVDEISVDQEMNSVCVPPPTKPEGITKDEMIDFIIPNTLFKKDELQKEPDEWIERMYLMKLRARQADELKGSLSETEITERCWKGYTQKGMKTMFGKRYPNCVKKKK
jgi:hypothetical protein